MIEKFICSVKHWNQITIIKKILGCLNHSWFQKIMYKISGWELSCLYSDGVASIKKSLFQVIQEIVEDKVSDEMLRLASSKYPHCTPKTKEAFYYRYWKYVLLINSGSFLWRYIFILVLFLINHYTLLYSVHLLSFWE